MTRLEAWCQIAKTNSNGGLELLRQAQRQYPQDETVPETISQVYLLMGEFTNALAAIDQQLKLNPKNIRALLNQGALCIKLKEYARAIPPLNRVLELEPGHRAALMNRSIANLQGGKLDAAEHDYQALREQLPKFHAAYYGLGEIAFRRKQNREAIAFYERFLEYAPPDTAEIKQVKERLATLKSGSR